MLGRPSMAAWGLVLHLCLCAIHSSQSFYLPGVAPQDFAKVLAFIWYPSIFRIMQYVCWLPICLETIYCRLCRFHLRFHDFVRNIDIALQMSLLLRGHWHGRVKAAIMRACWDAGRQSGFESQQVDEHKDTIAVWVLQYSLLSPREDCKQRWKFGRGAEGWSHRELSVRSKCWYLISPVILPEEGK